jgi:hypothetical protein
MTMKQERISNRDAHAYALRRKLFKGSNLYSEVRTSGAGTELYVIFSYGEHFPMFIAETADKQTAWYETTGSYSVTTAKHKTQARPRNVQLTHMEHDAMRQIALKGLVGHIMSGAHHA